MGHVGKAPRLVAPVASVPELAEPIWVGALAVEDGLLERAEVRAEFERGDLAVEESLPAVEEADARRCPGVRTRSAGEQELEQALLADGSRT
jgi:hypothetical protein